EMWAEASESRGKENLVDAEKDYLKRLHEGLEMTMGLLSTLINAKFVSASPIAGYIQGRERDSGQYKIWDTVEFLLQIRLEVLPTLTLMWNSDYVKDCPPTLTKVIFSMVHMMLKAEGEKPARPITPLQPQAGALPTIFGRTAAPVAPDEEKVQQLIDMGFPRAAAETALVRCHNSVGRAAEYLITHPNVVASATFSTSPSRTSAPASSGPSTSQAEASSQDAGATSSAQSAEGSSSSVANDGSTSSIVGSQMQVESAPATTQPTTESATNADPMVEDGQSETAAASTKSDKLEEKDPAAER
ncbi:hypothetical protein HDU67_005980, partial [Dinochytrium kinnereticum]